MKRISSNLTLALKIFFPTFWFVFFGVFGVAILVMKPDSGLFITTAPFKIAYLSFFILFSLLLYFTFIQIKRVDYNEYGIYISNFFKTYKYSFSSIQKLNERDYYFFKTVQISLKKAGKFGQTIRFIPTPYSYSEFLSFLEQFHPVQK